MAENNPVIIDPYDSPVSAPPDQSTSSPTVIDPYDQPAIDVLMPNGVVVPINALNPVEALKKGQEMAVSSGLDGAVKISSPRTDAPSIPLTEGTLTTGQKIAGVGGKALQGALFGGGDELIGGVATAAQMLQPGEASSFEENRLKAKEGLDRFTQENPKTALTAEVVGGLSTGVPGAKAFMRGGGGLLKQSVKSGIVGTAGGSLSGALSAEGGLRERLSGAADGAQLGLILGTAAPGLIAGGNAVFQKIKGLAGPKFAEARRLVLALMDDEISVDKFLRNLKRLGPEGTPVDAGGANVRRLGAAVAAKPGVAQNRAERVFDARQRGQQSRIAASSQRNLGVPSDKFEKTFDELTAARAIKATPFYEAAYKVQPAFTNELEGILQTPSGKKAFKRALQIAADRRETTNLPKIIKFVGEGEDAKLVIEAAPDMRGWDLIKRGFDSLVEGSRDQVTKKLNRSDPVVAAVDDLRKGLIKELDQLNPYYKTARSIFAGDSKALEAMQDGVAFMKGSARLTRQAMKNMSESDKEFFRIGAQQGILDVLDNTNTGASSVSKFLEKNRVREKLREVMPSPREYNQFKRDLIIEKEFAKTRDRVVASRGSKTTPLAEATSRESVERGVNFISDITSRGSVLKGTVAATSRALRNLGAPSDKMSKRLADVLFTNNRRAAELAAKGELSGVELIKKQLSLAEKTTLSPEQRAKLAAILTGRTTKLAE